MAIRVHEFVSLDGVYEDPSWTASIPFDPEMGAAIGEIMGASQALLLGRTTHAMFAPAWSARGEEEPGAAFMNGATKHVVSSRPLDVEWANTSRVGAYAPAAVRVIREDLYVSGSGTLVRQLLADDLVDELHLFVYPIVRGHGERLFTDQQLELELSAVSAYANGVVHLQYGQA